MEKSPKEVLMYNEEKYQEMYGLLVEQLLLRPESVVANLNTLIQGRNIDFELKILRADVCRHHREHADPYMFPFMTGQKGVPELSIMEGND